LFEHLCATCHDAGGEVRFYGGLNKLPPDLTTTAWSHVPNNASRQQVELQLMRIIKYGVPETNMAGHEYLNDAQLRALADYVLSRRSPSILH
jgi:cytochrome c oxidase cbb3-type subunit 2